MVNFNTLKSDLKKHSAAVGKGFPDLIKIDFSFEKKSDEEVEIADYAFTKACNFDEFIY